MDSKKLPYLKHIVLADYSRDLLPLSRDCFIRFEDLLEKDGSLESPTLEAADPINIQ